MSVPIAKLGTDLERYEELLHTALRANHGFKLARRLGSAEQFLANAERIAACKALTAHADAMRDNDRRPHEHS